MCLSLSVWRRTIGLESDSLRIMGSLRVSLLPVLAPDFLYTLRGDTEFGCRRREGATFEGLIGHWAFRGGPLWPTKVGVLPVMSCASCLVGILREGGRWEESLWERVFGDTSTIVLVSSTAIQPRGSIDTETPVKASTPSSVDTYVSSIIVQVHISCRFIQSL